MRISGAFLASWIAISAGELSAQYVVPPASPIASSTIALGSSTSTMLHERLDSLAVSIGDSGEVSLARHLAFGAVIGGVAGWLIARSRYTPGGDDWFGEDYVGALGAVTGIAAGALVGAIIWSARRPPKAPRDAQSSGAGHP
jgi:hypothetical protein